MSSQRNEPRISYCECVLAQPYHSPVTQCIMLCWSDQVKWPLAHRPRCSFVAGYAMSLCTVAKILLVVLQFA